MKENIIIGTKDIALEGILSLPKGAAGLVIFAHGSGSSRFSPRNTYVAGVLQQAGLATLLVDLMTEEEDADYQRRFDIPFLSKRLQSVVKAMKEHPKTKGLPLALFGASTGSASALCVAACMPSDIYAVVSRGGRPDMAMEKLSLVRCPTLLLVGALDDVVIELNEKAFSLLTCEKELIIIEGASHLFEEKGCLEKVAHHAALWFIRHLTLP